MRNYSIALYPGDGIGPEVTAEAVRALKAAAYSCGFGINFTEFNWGVNHWRKTGLAAPDDFLDRLRGFDAVFLGAAGAPDVMLDHVPLEPLIRMRQAFDQYAMPPPGAGIILPGVLPERAVSSGIGEKHSSGSFGEKDQ